MARRPDGVCVCVKRHSPPLAERAGEWHHIEPQGMGGPDTDENLVYLCGTGHNNVHIFMRTGKGGNRYHQKIAQQGIDAILRRRGYA